MVIRSLKKVRVKKIIKLVIKTTVEEIIGLGVKESLVFCIK